MPEVLLAGVSMRAAAHPRSRPAIDVATIDAFARSRSAAGSQTTVDAARADGAVRRAGRACGPRGASGRRRRRTARASKTIRAPSICIVARPRVVGQPARRAAPGALAAPAARRARRARVSACRASFDRPATRAAPPVGVAWLREAVPIRRRTRHPPWSRRAAFRPRLVSRRIHRRRAPARSSSWPAADAPCRCGISRQLAGDAAFGATGFQYCGSILSHPGRSLRATACRWRRRRTRWRMAVAAGLRARRAQQPRLHRADAAWRIRWK